MYELLENINICKLPKEQETKLVKAIPTSGFDPVADECRYEK